MIAPEERIRNVVFLAVYNHVFTVLWLQSFISEFHVVEWWLNGVCVYVCVCVCVRVRTI
jgi:hypothetical protein